MESVVSYGNVCGVECQGGGALHSGLEVDRGAFHFTLQVQYNTITLFRYASRRDCEDASALQCSHSSLKARITTIVTNNYNNKTNRGSYIFILNTTILTSN